MKDDNNLLETVLKVVSKSKNGNYYHNLYINIGGKSFELVPRARTVKEKAYFYSLLKVSDLV